MSVICLLVLCLSEHVILSDVHLQTTEQGFSWLNYGGGGLQQASGQPLSIWTDGMLLFEEDSWWQLHFKQGEKQKISAPP